MNLKAPLKLALILCLACLTSFASACRRGATVPDKSSTEYRELVSTFYIGVAALQVGDDARAEQKLKRVTELAPTEPAGWADWGLLALRRREYEAAEQRLEKARELAPQNGQLYFLRGLLESSRGKSAEAMAYLRRSVELSPKDLKALYLLASETERAGGEGSDAEAQSQLEKILAAEPNALAPLVEVARLAAKRGDSETLKRTVARLGERANAWPPETRAQLDALREAANAPDTRAAATRVAFLRNLLLSDAEYRRSLNAVKTPPEIIAEPFTRFLTLESPPSTPAPPDEQMTFNPEPVSEAGTEKWNWCGAVSLNGEGTPALLYANGREVQIAGGAKLSFPGGKTDTPPLQHGVLGLDYNYDFKTDLALAGAGGFRLYKQEDAGAFTDVTAQTRLPASIANAAYTGAWAADVDLDGDLDIVLGADKGAPPVLQNNGDGTFKEIRPFEGAGALKDFAWADLDGDGVPDAATLDQEGKLRPYFNERGGQFRQAALPEMQVWALSIADLDNDGSLDLVVLQANDSVTRLTYREAVGTWESTEITRVSHLPDNVYPEAQMSNLAVADIDNNGQLDVMWSALSFTDVWLGDQKGAYKRLGQQAEARLFAIADLDGDGRLDLIGLKGYDKPVRVINRGTKNYHWQVIRPRAQETAGDQRVNSFGVGGEIEIRAGLLTQKQVITGPLVHFGLGTQEQTDVARVIWPNGFPHAEFELKADQAVLAEQRLKGSCPSLFAYDGEEMRFVKDCAPWSPAIGLRINASQTLEVTQTEEWVKIRGDQLAPREGSYDLRITAELWETYYLDHYALLAVDHPRGTDIYVDERTARVAPELKVYTVATPQPFAHASDEQGKDVTEVVRALDGKYLDTFGRGAYQGITRDHYVELTLSEDAPRDGQLWLIAHGWLHPTDASINVAISQALSEPPHDLSLEVQDKAGGWRIVQPHLGFPSGKNKTILIDLSKVMKTAAAPRRLRLRTNMEIYWDALAWASGRPETEVKTERLEPATAELRYRGFSEMSRAGRSAPETPDYQRLADTTQRWSDLEGYYTRFGDVRELLEKVDDRYVIANAGDELRLRFQALPPVADGWERDYVLIGNGWIKDGDYNSMFSKTVLPLPSLGQRYYTTLPARLEDDPVYQRHKQDWQDYHTRYVTPQSFRNALRAR
ncbi:MAG: VCBS repeat-containing protein [Acidobacteria bacterium]|nr:VCBS repeat-containing protein [Acidobacteriota bacterium]